MHSFVLVALQRVLMLAIAQRLDAHGWNRGASLLVAAGVAIGAWTLTANRPGNFGILPEPKRNGVLVTGGPCLLPFIG